MSYFRKFLSLAIILVSSVAYAQQDIEMADQLRADGKIYVVVVSLTIILLGVLAYIIRLDSKISKLEKGKQ